MEFGLIWSKPQGTVASFERTLLKCCPFQITIPVLLVTDVQFARCAYCCSTSIEQFYRRPSYPSLLPCHPQEELKQVKEQKELQQDHLGLRVEGLLMLSAEFFVPCSLAQNGPSRFKIEPCGRLWQSDISVVAFWWSQAVWSANESRDHFGL